MRNEKHTAFKKSYKCVSLGFRGSIVDRNPPANGRDVSSILVQEDSTCRGPIKACVPQRLRLRAATAEAHAPRPVQCNKKSHRRKKPTHHNREQALLTATCTHGAPSGTEGPSIKCLSGTEGPSIKCFILRVALMLMSAEELMLLNCGVGEDS